MKNFIDKIKDQLTCNSNNSEHPTFDYTNKQVDDNIDYGRISICIRITKLFC